jgi:hypothetical protein
VRRSLLRASGIVVVAVFLLISGCNGLLQTEQREETLTPVPDTPTPASNAIPGVVNGRLAAPFDLTDAHRSWLSGRSYTITERVTVRNGTRSSYERASRVQWAGDDTGGYLATSRERPFSGCEGPDKTVRVERYATSDEVYSNRSRCGRESIGLLRAPDGDPADPRRFVPLEPTSYEFLSGVLPGPTAEEWQVSTARSGSFRLSAPLPGYSAPSFPFIEGEASARNASITLRVTDDGFVSDLRIRYTLVTSESRYTVVRTRTYDTVGETTVTRPEWVPEE